MIELGTDESRKAWRSDQGFGCARFRVGDAAPGQVGSSPEDLAAAQPLADAMSGMLLHYAATGNPNHPGLPAWPVYELDQRNTMIWDNAPHIAKDPRGEERRYAAASAYRQPGTY